MAKKTKFVRVDEDTLRQLKSTLAEMIARTGNTDLKIGDVIEALLRKREEKRNANDDQGTN